MLNSHFTSTHFLLSVLFAFNHQVEQFPLIWIIAPPGGLKL